MAARLMCLHRRRRARWQAIDGTRLRMKASPLTGLAFFVPMRGQAGRGLGMLRAARGVARKDRTGLIGRGLSSGRRRRVCEFYKSVCGSGCEASSGLIGAAILALARAGGVF